MRWTKYLHEIRFAWNRQMKTSLVVGGLALLIIFPINWQLSNGSDRLIFEKSARSLVQDMQLYLSRLQSAGSTLQTSYQANYDIDSDTFRILVQNLTEQMSSIKAVGFYPKVRPQDREDFIRVQREQGVPAYDIFTPSPDSLKYKSTDASITAFPLLYEEPFTPESAVRLGHDLYNDFEYADYVQTAITDDITWGFSETGEDPEMFILVPIYEGRQKPPQKDRSLNNLFGFIRISVDLQQLIRELFQDSDYGMQLNADRPSATDQRTLAEKESRFAAAILVYRYQISEDFTFMNQRFSVTVFEETPVADKVGGMLLLSLFISALAFLATYAFLFEQDKAHKQLEYIAAIEAEKMASMGRIVAGVAHEINTPLGVSVTTVSFLDKNHKELVSKFTQGKLSKYDLETYMADAEESISMLSYNLGRAAILVKNFKQMSRQQSVLEITRFDLRSCVDDLIISLKHEYKNKPIKLFNDCPDGLIMKSYPGVLVQILTNLIMNSLIHGFKDSKSGSIHILASVENDTVKLTYTDDGSGIPSHHQDRIFEPFFTTDRLAGNSGLGLSIVYNGVCQSLQGNIVFEENLPTGVRFILRLPTELKNS